MLLKKLALGVLVCIGAVATSAAHADTLTLKSVSNNYVGNTSVYPYSLSVNGSDATIAMMCLNYSNHVTVGETWQVTSQSLSTASSTAFKEDAFLFSQIGKGTYSDADIQFAVWRILDPSVVSNPGYDSTAKQLVQLAEQAASGLTDGFLSQYTVYSPVLSASSTWTDGQPQNFMAPSAVTPEPSSLVLLGSGLFSAGAVLFRRRKQDEASEIA